MNGDCVSDVVVVTHPGGSWSFGGTLRVISGADCSEILAISRLGCRTCVGEATCTDFDSGSTQAPFFPLSGPAVGDIDADGDLDIVVMTDWMRVVALEADGTFKWCAQSADVPWAMNPSIGDLDGDGMPEITAGNLVLRSDGSTAFALVPDGSTSASFADMDADGRLEVLTWGGVFRADGSPVWSFPAFATSVAADLDGDGRREIVTADPTAIGIRDGMTGAVLASRALPIPFGCLFPFGSAGAPSVGDLDGDGRPEIVVVTPDALTAWGIAGALATGTATLFPLWTFAIDECSSGVTTASLFDADGDGLLDVVHGDEEHVRILRGTTGALLGIAPVTSITWTECPVPADLDHDGHAEIVAVSSPSPAGCCDGGVRILHDPASPLPPARSIWNQHDYRVPGVEDDGGIPAGEGTDPVVVASYRRQPPAPPPSGGTGLASLSELWPPNHRMVFVSVDLPAGAAAIVSVTQDEPLDDLGDGDTSPDAVIVPGGVLLRAERSGRLDGRVYHLGWRAAASGCSPGTGTAIVCVPHDRWPGHACVDQGPLVDSLGP